MLRSFPESGGRGLLFLIACLALLSSACSSRVDTGNQPLSEVKVDCRPAGGSNQSEAGGGPSSHQVDMATEESVAKGCLTAWRKACAGDEKGALAMLNDLDHHYPGVLTIQMMMGQVYDHFGERAKAIEHYRRAATDNEFSGMHVFKLAEAMRKNGDSKGAANYYRKVLDKAPDFGPAALGLARCLLAADPKSSEARDLLKQASADQLAADEAKAVLARLEGGAPAPATTKTTSAKSAEESVEKSVEKSAAKAAVKSAGKSAGKSN